MSRRYRPRGSRRRPHCAQGVSTRSLVQALPALQTLAVLEGRDFVSPGDIEKLSVHLFQHRMSVVPGAGTAAEILRDAMKGPIDRLSRSTI